MLSLGGVFIPIGTDFIFIYLHFFVSVITVILSNTFSFSNFSMVMNFTLLLKS